MAVKAKRQFASLHICQILSQRTFFSFWGQSWSWLASHCPVELQDKPVGAHEPSPKTSPPQPYSITWIAAKSTSVSIVTRPKKSWTNGGLECFVFRLFFPGTFDSEHTLCVYFGRKIYYTWPTELPNLPKNQKQVPVLFIQKTAIMLTSGKGIETIWKK